VKHTSYFSFSNDFMHWSQDNKLLVLVKPMNLVDP